MHPHQVSRRRRRRDQRRDCRKDRRMAKYDMIYRWEYSQDIRYTFDPVTFEKKSQEWSDGQSIWSIWAYVSNSVKLAEQEYDIPQWCIDCGKLLGISEPLHVAQCVSCFLGTPKNLPNVSPPTE